MLITRTRSENIEDRVDLGTIEHRRLKFYVLTHNSHFIIAGKTLDLYIFDNFGTQLRGSN